MGGSRRPKGADRFGTRAERSRSDTARQLLVACLRSAGAGGEAPRVPRDPHRLGRRRVARRLSVLRGRPRADGERRRALPAVRRAAAFVPALELAVHAKHALAVRGTAAARRSGEASRASHERRASSWHVDFGGQRRERPTGLRRTPPTRLASSSGNVRPTPSWSSRRSGCRNGCRGTTRATTCSRAGPR